MDPTLADIPRILLRTTLRFIARIIFAIAWVALLITVILLGVSLLLGTWRSSRNLWRQAAASTIVAVTDIARAYRSEKR